MSTTISIDIKSLDLEIMLDPRKYGYGECARSKILGFDDQPNPSQTWVWKI